LGNGGVFGTLITQVDFLWSGKKVRLAAIVGPNRAALAVRVKRRDVRRVGADRVMSHGVMVAIGVMMAQPAAVMVTDRPEVIACP
jgi:hypothetical protein